MVADRLHGKRRAIIIGGSIMAAGHFMMTFQPLFYLALATIALSNGLFLPSLPSQIDDLYEPGDPRIGWAYNVYYVGVNIGGFLAPLICVALGEIYGWHREFSSAGVGMCLGRAIYVWGQRYLPSQARHPREEFNGPPQRRFKANTLVLLVAIAPAVTVFRGSYEQIGNTVALWADTGVAKQIGGRTIPMSWFISLNPLFVMLLTPPLLSWWRRRAAAGRPEAPARQMALGTLIVAVAYLLLAALALAHGSQPTGLGLFARLAPAGFGATTVAAWFLATFAGSLLGGAVGTLWSVMSHAAFFALLVFIALLAAAMLRACEPLERWVERHKQIETQRLD